MATDPRLRWVWTATFVSLSMGLTTSLFLPGAGLLLHERRPLWVVLGTVGIAGFTVAHLGALAAALTAPSAPARRRWLVALLAAGAASVPLAGPVAPGAWETWAWIGGSIVATVPLLAGRRVTAVTVGVVAAVAAGVSALNGDPAWTAVAIVLVVGSGVWSASALQVWMWQLLLEARDGREAQARLAATEERLRFARDVHDVIGHSLSVIALKAELAARLAPVDAGRAAREAAEVQRLAAEALRDVRSAVHGYRAVDLPEQLAAVEQVLRSSGIRCTVTRPEGALDADAAARLLPVLREASTNVLRHSRAGWCTIEVAETAGEVTMTVTNDGATAPAAPDPLSSGLRGMADRLAEAGGTLRTAQDGGVFTLEARLPAGTP